MRALCVVAVACVALVAGQGCKRAKREPVPGPQAVILGVSSATFGITARNSHSRNSPLDADALHSARSAEAAAVHGAGGIAWFQGSVEEAFSRTEARRRGGSNQHASQRCPG